MATTHTVKQGEYLASIAKKHGFPDWRTIYEHSQNDSFRQKRPNPNLIYPGDLIFIPDKENKEESCSAGQSYRFKVKLPKTILRIVLKDYENNPLKNAAFTLKAAGKSYQGTTDSDGLLEQEIPVGAETGELTLDNLGITWPIKIGHLDPIAEATGDKAIITGVQARLNNLGFYCGKVDGVLGPKTKAALKRFQEVALNREEPAGETDKETLDALQEQYGL